QVREVLERDGGSPILGEQGRVKLAADVHTAAKAALRGDSHARLTVLVVLDLARVAGVPIALYELIDCGEPVGDLVGSPTLRVAVGNALGGCAGTDDAVGADEAPKMSAENSAFGRLVQRLQVRVIGAHDLRTEHFGGHCRGDGFEQVGGI